MDSSGDEQLFEVESIVGKRQRQGKIEYLIRWKGFGQSEDSWEPVKNLQGCQELIKRFNKVMSPSRSRREKTPKSSRKENIPEEFTKLKQPKVSSTESDYLIVHRKEGPLPSKKRQKEEKKMISNVVIEQNNDNSKLRKNKTAQETILKEESVSKTVDGKRDLFKIVTGLTLFTLAAMVFLSFIPGVGIPSMNR